MNTYESVAIGRAFWATNAQKVQHFGTTGDFAKMGFAWVNKNLVTFSDYQNHKF